MRATPRWLAGLLVVLAVSSASGDDKAAEGVAAREAIVRLLEVGWPAGLAARAAADRQIEQVEALAPADPRAQSAMWLVLMQQRRYEQALLRIDEHLAKEPENPQALRAKAWTAAILKDYPVAMLAADKLSARLEEFPPITESDRASYEEQVAFLGRLYGFLGGPAAEFVNQDQRKLSEKKVLVRIDEAFRPAFEDARAGVLKKYIELTDDKAVERDRAVESAEAEKAKTLDEAAAEREEIAAREVALQERSAKLQGELKDQLDDLAQQDKPLAAELARLEARAGALNRDLLSYEFDIDRLERLAALEKDPVLRQQYRLEADRLALIASRIDSELIGINRLARGVQQQRAALAAQGQQAQATTAGQFQRIDAELKDLAKRMKRIGGIEKRAARPASGTTSKVRSLSAQATALTTYDPFPLEAIRARLLDSLK